MPSSKSTSAQVYQFRIGLFCLGHTLAFELTVPSHTAVESTTLRGWGFNLGVWRAGALPPVKRGSCQVCLRNDKSSKCRREAICHKECHYDQMLKAALTMEMTTDLGEIAPRCRICIEMGNLPLLSSINHQHHHIGDDEKECHPDLGKHKIGGCFDDSHLSICKKMLPNFFGSWSITRHLGRGGG